MPRLRENERIQVVLQLASDVMVYDVARQFNCHRNTVFNLRQLYECSESVRGQPRIGRPRVTTVRQYLFITLSHLRNRFKTATSTGNYIHVGINKQTVVNCLHHNGQLLRAMRPYVGQVLNHRHRNAMIRRHLRWTRAMLSGYFSVMSLGFI